MPESTLQSKLEKNESVQLKSNGKFMAKLWQKRYVYLLLLPGLLYFLIYKYLPMFGNIIAFEDYSPFMGFLHSDWVGFKHFREIFANDEVVRVIWNTLYLSSLQLVFAFPAAIILSVLLNELRSEAYKRVIQSIVYLPHFFSWVVIVGIVFVFLKLHGFVNQILGIVFHIHPIHFLTSPGFFMPLIVLEVIWKETGWGTILFLAAIAGINPNLYEAAIVDGANRWRQIWHITLPSIRNVIVILFILRLGGVLDTGFEQIFLHLNAFNRQAGQVLDTYVYFKGIQQGNYSFSTAVGLFKSVVGLILILIANRLAKSFGDEGLY